MDPMDAVKNFICYSEEMTLELIKNLYRELSDEGQVDLIKWIEIEKG